MRRWARPDQAPNPEKLTLQLLQKLPTPPASTGPTCPAHPLLLLASRVLLLRASPLLPCSQPSCGSQVRAESSPWPSSLTPRPPPRPPRPLGLHSALWPPDLRAGCSRSRGPPPPGPRSSPHPGPCSNITSSARPSLTAALKVPTSPHPPHPADPCSFSPQHSPSDSLAGFLVYLAVSHLLSPQM